MKVKINFSLSEISEKIEKFFLERKIFLDLPKKFLECDEIKKNNFLNQLNWFFKKIKISNFKDKRRKFRKWEICYANFGINIGTEINGIRPVMIYKSNHFLGGNDLIVIPMTSFKGFEFDKKTHVFLEKNDTNFLGEKDVKKESLLKLQHIQVISKRRLIPEKYSSFFLLNEDKKNEIDLRMIEILGIKNEPPYEDGGCDLHL